MVCSQAVKWALIFIVSFYFIQVSENFQNPSMFLDGDLWHAKSIKWGYPILSLHANSPTDITMISGTIFEHTRSGVTIIAE